MTEWPSRIQELVNGIAASVAVVGHDDTGALVVSATHELEVSTSRFRSVVDAAYDAIITIDQQHNITLFNRAAEPGETEVGTVLKSADQALYKAKEGGRNRVERA